MLTVTIIVAQCRWQQKWRLRILVLPLGEYIDWQIWISTDNRLDTSLFAISIVVMRFSHSKSTGTDIPTCYCRISVPVLFPRTSGAKISEPKNYPPLVNTVKSSDMISQVCGLCAVWPQTTSCLLIVTKLSYILATHFGINDRHSIIYTSMFHLNWSYIA